MRTRLNALIVTGLALTTVLLTGCPAPVPPPAEAVLAGTWRLEPGEQFTPPLSDWFLTFDSNGELTRVTYTFAGFATVTWNNPPAATTVNGSSVYISVSQSGNGLIFSGTLNSSNTVATGTLSSNLVVGGITISVSQGPATLTKQ